jgi:mannonate dehydratase
MSKLTRRESIGRSLCVLGGAAATPALQTTAGAASQNRIKLAMALFPGETANFRLTSQMGLKHGIARTSLALGKVPRSQYVDGLAKIKAEFESYGLSVAGVEAHPVPANLITLGLPGRDEQLENYVAGLKAMAEVGFPLVAWNFMAGFNWLRTRTDAPERGGAVTTVFDMDAARKLDLTEWGEVSEERMWDNITYFLKAVIPVAEKLNIKMALHPDDPPLSPIRGIARICSSARNYRRIMNIVPSPINGVTFCQANFVAMGEDIEALFREWSKPKKIFFIHFRDIVRTRDSQGKLTSFRETFHDNGQTDMVKMLKVYHECGFDGPIRPDHAPTMEGDSNERAGYALKGLMLSAGFMSGALRGMNIPHE